MVLPLLFNRLGPMIGRRREREDSGDEDEPPNKVIILCHCKPFFKFIFLFPSSYTCYQGRRNGSVTFGRWVTTSLEQFQVFRIHCVLSCTLFSHFPSPSCVYVYIYIFPFQSPPFLSHIKRVHVCGGKTAMRKSHSSCIHGMNSWLPQYDKLLCCDPASWNSSGATVCPQLMF